MRCMLVAALAVLAASAPSASAHEGNPNFRSTITSIGPPAPGVEAEVLNYDDSLELRVAGGHRVEVAGYDGEPYLRFLPDGTVEVNRVSPSHHLNEDRFGEVDVPAGADPDAPPEWKSVASNGVYAWHDHRIHWMARSTPPQVTDEDERTKVFDWHLPIAVDGEQGRIAGELYWTPTGSSFPVAAGVALGAALAAAVAFVIVVRRRRRRDRGEREKEAW